MLDPIARQQKAVGQRADAGQVGAGQRDKGEVSGHGMIENNRYLEESSLSTKDVDVQKIRRTQHIAIILDAAFGGRKIGGYRLRQEESHA
ncbi:hypothetical protein [Sphingobium yanoikuyae]|uniref:hypothetical protein n=1 Tax=Sphingobium yanoikuyae TaxID=13690 RepID=UPI0015580BB1|nr:hypothetical protein [Sphingobium yanoikuyae]